MKIQILMSPGCGHGERTLKLVTDIVQEHALGASVEAITVATLEDATRWSFPGSPTVRVDGLDIDPEGPASVGLG